MLEHLRGRRERGGDVGRRVADVVGAAGIQEAAERVVIAGERQLDEGAAAEDDETEPVAGRGGGNRVGEPLGPGQPSTAGVGDVHRARQVEQHEHVPSRPRDERRTLADLGPCSG